MCAPFSYVAAGKCNKVERKILPLSLAKSWGGYALGVLPYRSSSLLILLLCSPAKHHYHHYILVASADPYHCERPNGPEKLRTHENRWPLVWLLEDAGQSVPGSLCALWRGRPEVLVGMVQLPGT